MDIGKEWFMGELLDTFCMIVDEYRTGMMDEKVFHDRIFTIADRYARHVGKDVPTKEQMTLFSSSVRE